MSIDDRENEIELPRLYDDRAYAAEVERRRLAGLPPGYRQHFNAEELTVFSRYDNLERTVTPIAEIDLCDRQITLTLVARNGALYARITDDLDHDGVIPFTKLWRYHHPCYQRSADDRALIDGLIQMDQLHEFGTAFADLEEVASVWFGQIDPDFS